MTAPDTRTGRWDGALCGLVVVLCILVTRPFVEIGIIDDFSYIQTAFVFARTGHFVYNGWATAMLGWQIPYGALFIRIFGYHVWPLHLSNIVLAALAIPLLHNVLRRSGLRRDGAAFAAVLTGLSPIFLPLAASYMTDIGGLLTLTLCWYALLRALDATEDRAVLLWLLAGTVTSVIGGTARQIVWVGALTMMPAAAWLLRRRKAVVPVAAVLWIASVASVLLSLRWFKHQPLSVPEPLIQGTVGIKDIRQLAGNELAAALCLLMLVLPVFVACIPRLTRWTASAVLKLTAATALVTIASRLITVHIMEHGWMPWTGDVVERLGILDYNSGWLLGVEPVMFSQTARVVASFVIVGIGIAGISRLYATQRSVAEPNGVASNRTQTVLLGGLLAGYLGLLLPRGTWFEILDRYLLPLIPVIALIILRMRQRRSPERLPIAAWAALAVWAFFATAGTHDWLQTRRARLAAVATLGQAGIPPEHINAGYEMNGMTQIQLAGTIIDKRVTYPPTMHLLMKPVYPSDLPAACRGIYYDSTPMVQPNYFLAHQVIPCLQPSRFGTVPYTTWLPPYNRSIAILERAK